MLRFLLPSSATQRPSRVLRYSVALVTLALALGLSLLFRSFIVAVPFILFFAAVAVNAWYGGFAVGVASALAAVLLVDFFLTPPFTLFASTLDDLLRAGIFVFVASLISALSEARRRAEERAQAEAERFFVTLASIGDAVIATDTAGRVTFLNASAEVLTGWRKADAIGQEIATVFQIIDAGTRQPVESPVAGVLREGIIVGLANHTLLIARDGSERPIDNSGAPIRNRQSRLTGVVLVFRDISERVQAEAALQASRDQLAVILAGVADGIVAEAPGGRVVYANEVAAHAIGYPSVEAMFAAAPGEWLQRFAIMDEDGQPLPSDQLPGRLALQGAENPTRVVRYRELESGHERWSLVQARPVRDAIGRVQLAIVLMHDITAQKQAEQERTRLLAREQEVRAAAEATVRVRDQFLSVAAHELRTPLTILLGQVQLFQRRAERDGNLTDRDQRALRIVNDQINRLNKMVLALLDMSRLELGQLSIERAPMDVCALVRRVVNEVRPTASDRVIELRCPEIPIVIQGDDLRLEQVLQNLIQNALKYSQPPAPIGITVTQQAGEVCVAVQDQGIGIPADALPKLFQRFYRANNAEAQHISGMGIGLYVVQEIASLHSGRVMVESIEGAGSTFTLCLPMNEPASVIEQELRR